MTLIEARQQAQIEANIWGVAMLVVKDKYSDKDTPYEFGSQLIVDTIFIEPHIVETIKPVPEYI